MRTSHLLGVLLIAPLSAQNPIVVQGGGGALANAIAIANPGDELDVFPGNYTPVTVQRALRIALRSGASVGAWLSTTAGITVSGLPVGEAVVITGGTLQGVSAVQCAGVVLVADSWFDFGQGGACQITNCTGPVAFEDIAQPGLPYHGGSLAIQGSSQVSFTRCALPRAIVTASHVTMAQPDIFPYGGRWPHDAPSLQILSGTVSIRGGRIAGGVAASLPYYEYGIQLVQGELTLAGGVLVQSTIDWGVPTAAAVDTLGGLIRMDPATRLIGTVGLQGPATVWNNVVPTTSSARTAGSSSTRFDLTGVPTAVAFTLLGFAQPALPTIWGDVWLDPGGFLAAVTPLSNGGSGSLTVQFAGVPPFLLLVAQTATLDPTGAIAVSPPERFLWD
ncbi:MAG: hypothetical protein IPK26_07335 [Planctomycetes bacterium]|nr:hypothetical protein [Planctomycetota bacterium]